MATSTVRDGRAPRRMLKSPLAVPGAPAAASPNAFESLTFAHHRTALSDREATLAEFQGYLRTVNNRFGRLRQCRQADIDEWLATVSASAAESTRGFLDWAARHGHCPAFAFPSRQRHAGPAISDSRRWEHATRLLRDDSVEPADRAAGCLVLLYGQNVTRIAALTISQVTRHDGDVHIRLGKHDIPVPLALGTLVTDGKPYTGIGTPEDGKWLFPGLLPGQPITPERLTARLNAIGIPVRAARRAALTGLAAQVPATVLGDALGIHPATAVNWTHDAGSDWNLMSPLRRRCRRQPASVGSAVSSALSS